jgi:hydrogenase 3 maturation protease
MDERKTLPATWKTALSQLLRPPTNKPGELPRIAILGVGNPLRSDDAAGVLVARLLLQRAVAAATDDVLILEAGHAPENRTGELRKFAPEVVLIIDAADIGEKPGTIQLIPEASIDGMSASTHSLPLSMLAHYLKSDLDCVVAFLGIQPDSNEVGERVSPEVLAAVNELVDALNALMH